MAFMDATLWNDIQGDNATNEKRFSPLGVVDLVADSTSAIDYILPSQIQALNTVSSLRAVKIPVIKDQTVTVGTTPGFNFIPSNYGESATYSYTTYNVFSGFRHNASLFANNVIDSDFARAQVMKNVAYEMGKTISGILVTNLEARKTQVLNNLIQVSQGTGAYTFSANTLTVSKGAQTDTMFFNLEALMASNELGGQYRIVTNRAGLSYQKSRQLTNGTYNATNLEALGMFPLDRMYESGNISAGSDVFSGFLVRDGAIGIIPNFPYDFVNGTELAGKKWSITDMELPFCRMRANIYTNREATNSSALVTGNDSNGIMSTFEEMGIWCRFTVVYKYNSDLSTRANDIVKIVGATS